MYSVACFDTSSSSSETGSNLTMSSPAVNIRSKLGRTLSTASRTSEDIT